ncbi:MAG: ABC transporter ATP-binding protein [Phycisphaerae bacterium]|nr:ABC transporter ATP-binding protein [Phycisphaerae bacterium]
MMQSQVRQALEPDESLLLLTDADLLDDGSFGQRWLVVTDRRVLVFTPNGNRLDAADEIIPLQDIDRVESVPRVGHMSLVAHASGRRIELVRYTNSLSEKFAKIARALDDTRRRDKPLVFDLTEERARLCMDCGRLLPERGGFCPACLKKRSVLSRFWKYMRPDWPAALVVIGCMLAATAVGLVPPYLIKVLVDDVITPKGNVRLLEIIVAALVAAHLLSIAIQILQGRVSARLSTRILHDVRVDFFQAVQYLSLRRHDLARTGGLISRVSHDTQLLNAFFMDMALAIVPQVLQMLGVLLMLFVLDWRLAILVIVPAPAIYGMSLWFHKRIRGRFARQWQRQSRMTARASDAISGIRIVKAFAQEPSEIGLFGVRSDQLRDAQASSQAFLGSYFPAIRFVIMLGAFLVWYFGGMGVIGEGSSFWRGITFGTLMAFLGYLGMLYNPLNLLARVSDYFNRAATAAQRLFEIADADQEIYDAADAQPMPKPQGAIRFDNVHFGYTKDKRVLKGMNLDVRPGEMIGLVGKSGVGKTTMINLICRFYDVDEGAILLDGVDIRKIKLRDLRGQIGIVPQEPYLFNASIAENIAYGKPGASRDEIIRAAVAANAHGFIMRQTDGYDTRVGERGARLSGGERQRLAIARAILHDPKILILDEATSAVDTETEELIQQALARLVKHRTTFAIAHRLSTLRNADRLLVIDDGKAAELGTHPELLKKRGLYHRLVVLQSKLSKIQAVGG